jgi:hypothetical protein
MPAKSIPSLKIITLGAAVRGTPLCDVVFLCRQLTDLVAQDSGKSACLLCHDVGAGWRLERNLVGARALDQLLLARVHRAGNAAVHARAIMGNGAFVGTPTVGSPSCAEAADPLIRAHT